MKYNKIVYHAGDFSRKYGTLKQGLSGTSFLSGYYYCTSKEKCENQGADSNLENKRSIYSFSLKDLTLFPISAKDCKTINKFNTAMYYWPIWCNYFGNADSIIYEEIYEALLKCFEDYYCDECESDMRAVKFFREISEAYNIDKESNKDYTFQDFIKNDYHLSRLTDWVRELETDAYNTFPYLTELLLNTKNFIFTDDQNLVHELDTFLNDWEIATFVNKKFEDVAKLLNVKKSVVLDEGDFLYKKYKNCYINGKFDNWKSPEKEDLFATQLLMSLGYEGTYPLNDADNIIWGGVIFNKDKIKDIKLVS